MALTISRQHEALGETLLIALTLLVSVGAAPSTAPSRKSVDQAAFEQALSAYESRVHDFVQLGNPEERASAIRALAALGSPTYPAARDALLGNQEPDVQVALLDAMGLMGDTSDAATSYLERAFASADHRIVDEAIRIEYQYLRMPLNFRKLWSPKRANYLWADYFRTSGWVYWNLIGGVGGSRPWVDPAWADLTDMTRMSLLFRAGTRESVSLGTKLAMAQNPPKWWGLLAAEPADLAFMRELLQDSHLEVRKYAARTLLAAKDPWFLAKSHDLIGEYHRGTANIPDSALDEYAVESELPLLSDSELTGLLMDDPAKWFQPVLGELAKRGHPISYADLRGRRQPSPLFNIAAILTDLLRAYQLQALFRERVFNDFPDYVDLALMNPNTAAAMSDLEHGVANVREFRADIPPNIARTCREKLQQWLAKSPKEGGPHYIDGELAAFFPATNPNGADEAKKLVFMLASPDERDAAWQRVRASKEPFKQVDDLQIVLWGCDERAEALRAALAPYRAENWFCKRIGYPTLDALQCSMPEGRSPDPCESWGKDQWLPVILPVAPPSLKTFRDDLASAIAKSGATDEKSFARAFLLARGITLDEADPGESARWLAGPNVAIRRQALALLGESIRLAGLPFPQYASLEESSKWVEANRQHLEPATMGPSERQPTLAPEDSAWLMNLLHLERNKYIESLVEDLIHPKPSGMIACGGPMGFGLVTPSVWSPSEVFIREAGMEFEPEIRALLGRPEPIVRHAAAWALWRMLRDPEGLNVFKKDSRAADPKLRASALNTLVRLRRVEESALFPPLLLSQEPLLRQVGLSGVQAFGLRQMLPNVLDLVTDQDVTVSSMAIDTLGEWHPIEARPLLLKLVLDDGPQAGRAAMAFTHYRTPEDLDLVLSTASAQDTTEISRVRLLGIISQVTGRMGLQVCDPFMSWTGREKKLSTDTLSDWQSWWKNHRQETLDRRVKAVLAENVKLTLEGKDESPSIRARYWLKAIVPNTYCLDNPWPLSPQCKETLTKWWRESEKEDSWTILAISEGRSQVVLDMLNDLDAARTRKLLFRIFFNTARGGFHSGASSYSPESDHDRLVRCAGVDFGDPGPAKCGTKERMLADWLSWAQKEGWAE